MAMSAPRASVFTFESTVHSSHVLRCLDDQRRRDVLCDVTLVVEGRSFRAHRSVLASCSEYFTHRTSCLSPHGAVVTLPREVTVAGFEPLLKFAYTSKLLFGKDSVLEIRNAASVLGFRDLDEACFDFLLPKFFSSGGGSSKGSLPFPRKTCCKKKNKRPLSKEDCSTDSDAALLDEKEAKPVADSTSQQEVAVRCEKSERGKTGSPNTKGTTTPVAEGAKDNFTQCPKYRKFQLACGKDACGAEKSLSSLATVIRDECEPSCSPCSSQNETAQANPAGLSSDGADEPRKTEIHDKKTEGGVAGGGVRAAQRDTNEREDGTKTEEEMMAQTAGASSPDRSRVKAVPVGESTVPGERSPGSIMHLCPLRALAGGPAMTRSWGQERFVCMGLKEDKKPRDSCVVVPVSIRQNAGERVEAEGKRAENAWEERGEEGPVGITEKGTLPVNPAREGSADVGSPQPISQAPDAGRSSDAAGVQVQSSSLEWLKLHVDLAASGGTGGGGGGAGGGCPFLQELDQGKRSWQGAGLSECEGASHSGVSSLNSGEDGDSETETEGDSESYARERARQVQLPFSVAWIVDLSRNDFQQLLKQQALTCEQLEFVHDMRRRSKNRLAAQRCRKRKLDCIYNLQCEINKLKTEREKLIAERSQLSQMKLSTCHSVSALCQRVRSDANLQPEQLRVLAKYASPDCPLTSAFPHTDALLLAPALPVPPLASLSSRFVGLDMCTLAEDARPLSGRDAATGGDRRPL